MNVQLSNNTQLDVAVLGLGPAGRAALAACHAAGLSAVGMAPRPDAPWPDRYGAFVDDLAAVGVDDCVLAAWPTARVIAGESFQVARGYARVDSAALQRRLASEAPVVDAEVVALEHDPDGTDVRLADGRVLRARVVVDATGAVSRLRNVPAPRAFQTAWGVLAKADRIPWDSAEMLWMDFRGDGETFLYAMAMPGGRVFVEETALAASPAVPLRVLERRLYARMSRMGVTLGAPEAVERCVIPLDVAIPRPSRLVPFGASAGMVHPATGYLLTRVLSAAPVLAEALSDGNSAGQAPEEVAHAAHQAVWPAAARRTRALHDLGLQVLLRLDGAATRGFFERFFRMSQQHQRAWLSPTAAPLEVAAAMTSLFSELSPALRLKVARTALGAPVRDLVAHLGGLA